MHASTEAHTVLIHSKKNNPAQPRRSYTSQEHSLAAGFLCWKSECVLLMHRYFLKENTRFSVHTVHIAESFRLEVREQNLESMGHG